MGPMRRYSRIGSPGRVVPGIQGIRPLSVTPIGNVFTVTVFVNNRSAQKAAATKANEMTSGVFQPQPSRQASKTRIAATTRHPAQTTAQIPD